MIYPFVKIITKLLDYYTEDNDLIAEKPDEVNKIFLITAQGRNNDKIKQFLNKYIPGIINDSRMIFLILLLMN